MTDIAMLDKFIMNDEILSTDKFETIYKPVHPICYDVVRVMNGKPLFFTEHYERFERTIRSTGHTIPYTMDEIADKFRTLISVNNATNYNVKLIYNDFENDGNMFIFFTTTLYPTEEMYVHGIPIGLMRFERANPNSKIFNVHFRDSVDAFLKEKHLFEALLISRHGEITEGSRSNVFFIRGGEIHTCPEESVLQGVTRKHILQIAAEAGLNIIEEPVAVTALPDFESAFLSGTSPKVLPIKSIDSYTYDVNNPELRNIMKFYENDIEEDLASWK